MNDMVLASKDYVDNLVSIHYCYDANIYKTAPPPAPMQQVATFINCEYNVNGEYSSKGKMLSIDLMLPVLYIPIDVEPAYVCLKKSNNVPFPKPGDLCTESDFLYKSVKEYTKGTYYNVEFTTALECFEVGPGLGWTGWLDSYREARPVVYVEKDGKRRRICLHRQFNG